MSEANHNPYQSPQGLDGRQYQPEMDQLTLAELQARVLALEAKLEASHLFGPLWKRCLTVFVYFFLAYAVIGLIVGAIALPISWLMWRLDF